MDGQVRPPQLAEINYAYWKAHTKVYLQSQGTRMWRAVVNGWECLTMVKEDKIVALKPESQWTTDENAESEFYNKALNTIMGSLDESQFSLIDGCTQVKQAWDILEVVYEDDVGVKQLKLQQVHTNFQKLKMRENEKIIHFNAQIQELKNEDAILGNPFLKHKLVRKILRSLP